MGVTDEGLKDISQTLEDWMEVSSAEGVTSGKVVGLSNSYLSQKLWE